jgi:Ni,Fe-hydrogenase III small subunit/ferredoxin
MSWIWRALRRGILTTRYPNGPAEMPDGWRGVARAVAGAPKASYERGAAACLSRAIDPVGDGAVVHAERCFQCGQCAIVAPDAFVMTNEYELALMPPDLAVTQTRLARRAAAFGKSIFVRHVDAGSDFSCDQEVQALFNPFYDLNRLGIFLTATPRHADLLLVTGAVTVAMRQPLQRTFAAMPEPKLVVAVGTAASSGSIYGDDALACAVDRVLPVDVKVPGAPPPPLSIMHGIWVALGRTEAHARERHP